MVVKKQLVLGVGALLLATSACSLFPGDEDDNGGAGPSETLPENEPSEDPTESDPSETPDSQYNVVGHPLFTVSEGSIDSVAEIDLGSPKLFISREDWDDWYETEVPEDVRERLEYSGGPTFDNSVAVASAVPICDESVSVIDRGDGELAVAINYLDDVQIDCYWSPIDFTVFEVSLAEIGIDHPEDVVLDSTYDRI